MSENSNLLGRIATALPTKRSLHSREMQVIKLKDGHTLPQDKGGIFLYVNIEGELFRTKLDKVDWRE